MKASFKPRARLLKLLGEQLIGTPQLAIFELVKNAYDADADEVKIVMRDVDDPKKATIEITDFGGEGMDMDTIVNVWLEPGADHKEKKRENRIFTKKHKRLPLGEKGVGRFAVHKLGKKINLITKAKDHPEISVSFDWESLDNCTYIDETEVEIIENQQPRYFAEGETGTHIIISDLNVPLGRKEVRNLYRNIQSIQSPFEYGKFKLSNKTATFEASLEVPDHPEWVEELYDIKNIINQALFKFTFFVENGKLSWVYEFNPSESLQSKYEEVVPREANEEYQPLELKGYDEYSNDPENFLCDIGPIVGEIYVFDFDSEVKNFYNKTNAVKRFVDENKGIRIYRDGIRIYNYGEPQDDWLSLDSRRVNRSSHGLSRGITVGAISLDSSHASNLVEKTNREGFVENESFEKFRDVIKSVIGKLESLRYNDKDGLLDIIKTGAKSSTIPIEESLEEIKKIVIEEKMEKKLLPKIKKIEKRYYEMRDIVLRSGGLNMSIAFHEIYKGIKDTKKIVEEGKDKKIILKQFKRFETILDTYSEFLKNEKMKKYSLKKLLQGNKELADIRFEMHNILCSCPILVGDQPDFEVEITPQLVISAVNNLIDNAIYWLDQRWENEKDKKYLYIGVSKKINKGPAIIIADNGPGWKNIDPSEVVLPFRTTKSGGMGIGLYYTKTVMEMLGGELSILNPEDVDAIPKQADGAVVELIFKKES